MVRLRASSGRPAIPIGATHKFYTVVKQMPCRGPTNLPALNATVAAARAGETGATKEITGQVGAPSSPRSPTPRRRSSRPTTSSIEAESLDSEIHHFLADVQAA